MRSRKMKTIWPTKLWKDAEFTRNQRNVNYFSYIHEKNYKDSVKNNDGQVKLKHIKMN